MANTHKQLQGWCHQTKEALKSQTMQYMNSWKSTILDGENEIESSIQMLNWNRKTTCINPFSPWQTNSQMPFQESPNLHSAALGRKLAIWATTEGYCYLRLYKRCYHWYAKEKYGAYPYFGALDLRKEYRSGDFNDLKISVYHVTE